MKREIAVSEIRKKLDLTNENIAHMSKSDLRCALVDLRISNDRLRLQKEIYEICGRMIYIQHLQAVRDMAKQLVDSCTEDDVMLPCWEVK
jgi:hypothetical protein